MRALWNDGELIDLFTESGGVIVHANAINDAGEVVGLNLQLLEAHAINDRGEIAADAFPPGCNVDDRCVHAFVLIPVYADGTEGCADANA